MPLRWCFNSYPVWYLRPYLAWVSNLGPGPQTVTWRSGLRRSCRVRGRTAYLLSKLGAYTWFSRRGSVLWGWRGGGFVRPSGRPPHSSSIVSGRRLPPSRAHPFPPHPPSPRVFSLPGPSRGIKKQGLGLVIHPIEHLGAMSLVVGFYRVFSLFWGGVAAIARPGAARRSFLEIVHRWMVLVDLKIKFRGHWIRQLNFKCLLLEMIFAGWPRYVGFCGCICSWWQGLNYYYHLS